MTNLGLTGPLQLGELIRTHRHRAGMTQRQLADLAALSIRSIRDLESGRVRRPRQQTVQLLNDALRLADPQRRAMESAAVPAGGEGGHGSSPAPLGAANGALVGREDELQWLTGALGWNRQRFVSIVGVSGVGATRLALEAASLLRDELAWPVLWLDARHLTADPPSGVGWEVPEPPPMLRRVVELLTTEDQRTAAAACAELVEILGVGSGLLVIDGISADTPHRERLVELLQRCPGLRVLTTGLAPLGVHGEQVLPLAPLSVPTPHTDPEDYAAVRLFMLHMQRIRPGYARRGPQLDPIVELCRLFEGLPRAITYAAEWCLMNSPAQLLEQLAPDPLALTAPSSVSGPPLRASLQRTVDALEPELSFLLRCLSGLAGPWTLTDAHALVGGTWSGLNRMVHQLVVRGLVRHSAGDQEDRFTVSLLVHLMHR